jgi:hypothetical protein
MSSVPTPNYLTQEEYSVKVLGNDKVLPANSFVRPIEYTYVPKYLKEIEDMPYQRFNPQTEVFCYTHWGIVVLPLKLLRRVG